MKRLKPAAELKGDLVGREVSCGVLPELFAAAREDHFDLEALVEGTGYPLEHYLNPTERVSWAALQQIGERLGERWSEAELRSVGARSIAIQHFEPQVFLARLLLKPTEAYAFIIRGDSQGDFACLSAETTVNGQHVDIEITTARGYGPCPAVFWIFCGAAEATPGIFGLPSADVEVRMRDQGVHLSIEVPRGGGRWSWFDRVRQGFWRNRRMDDVGDRLSQRTVALETEVAKRLTVEADLKAALDEHRRRLANLNDVVVELDVGGVVTFVSSNISPLLRISEDDFRADPWRFLQPPDGDVSSSWMSCLEGTGRWVEVNPSRYSDDGSSALLLVVRDVTDRVELAEQLSSALRLESLGVMAAGVAHDFNNLLVPIVANAGSILGDLPSDSSVRDRVVAIERAAGMASQLTEQILASTGRSIPADESCDVAAVVREMIPVLVEVVPDGVEVVFDVDGSMPARVDQDSVAKLLTNLVVNAGQAIEGIGRVVVAVMRTDDEVVLRVNDDGAGMTAETAARISEPFFTTRSTGRGLGLASLAGMLQSETASLEVVSAVGRGTTISVSFEPVTADLGMSLPSPQSAWPSSDAKVLLIDDDELVRQTVHRLLERMFASVYSVPAGRRAAEMLETDLDIDCVVTDLTMPDVRGPELIVQLRGIRPNLSAIIITGAGVNMARAELDAAGLVDVAVLSKPFSPTQLFDAVVAQLQVVV